MRKVFNNIVFNLRPQLRPGKYEGGLLIDEIVDNSDYFDETCSTEYGGFHWGLLRGGFDAETLAKHPELTADEAAFLASIAGAVVLTTHTGFVTVDYFETTASLELHWAKAREYAASFGDTPE